MIHDAPQAPWFMLRGAPFTELYLTPDHDFYLTGSQFFGCATPTSDWDFIAQESKEMRAFLEANAFTVMGTGGAKKLWPFGKSMIDDAVKQYVNSERPYNITTSVWQHKTDSVVVQVQLTSDVGVKRRCRDIIAATPQLLAGHRLLDKEGRSRLWDALAETLLLGVEHPPVLLETAAV